MTTLEIILSLVTCIFGGTSFFTVFLFLKQQKRYKNAEAFEKELTALRLAQENWEKELKWQTERVDKLQNTILEQDLLIRQLRNDRNTIEIKNARNKSAINSAYGCKFANSEQPCPVLEKRSKNEEEFAAMLEEQHKKHELLHRHSVEQKEEEQNNG